MFLYLCSCLTAFFDIPLPVRGDLSPINLKRMRKEICDEVWSTEFEVVLQHCHCQCYRFRFSPAKERNYQWKFFFKSHVKCTGLKISVNAHFHFLKL